MPSYPPSVAWPRRLWSAVRIQPWVPHLGADTPGTATIDILPLELSIAGLDGANFRGDQSEIVVTVSAGGVPAPDVTVDMVATHGLVEDYTRQSDAQGQVRVPLLHLRPGE